MDAFIGEIRLFPYSYGRSVSGWCLCDGRKLSISQYPALNSIISNLYGGDLKTYFNIPNLTGQAVMGSGTGGGPTPTDPPLTPRKVGDQVGARTTSIEPKNIPSHTHQVVGAAYTNASNVDTPDSTTILSAPFNIKVYTQY
ncbi:MAG: phage tail protein, partial [Microvirgula sp.]